MHGGRLGQEAAKQEEDREQYQLLPANKATVKILRDRVDQNRA